MKRIALSLILFSGMSFNACTQTEVMYEKTLKMINDKIGKYEVKIKDAEKLLEKMEAARKKALIGEKVGSSNLSQSEKQALEVQKTITELTGHLEKIQQIEDKGAPYLTSKGQEISRSKLNELKNSVSIKLNIEIAKKKGIDQALRIAKKSNTSNAKMAEQLNQKSIEIRSKIQILKNNIDILHQMEEQARLKKEYDSTLAGSLLKDIDKAIMELETGIEIDLETVFEEDRPTQPGGLKSDEVDLLDSL